MRKMKNRVKTALALLLSAAMIIGAAPVSQAAEEEMIMVAEDVQTVGQSETIADSMTSQDKLSVEEISVEEMEQTPEAEATEPEAESTGLEVPEGGAAESEIPETEPAGTSETESVETESPKTEESETESAQTEAPETETSEPETPEAEGETNIPEEKQEEELLTESEEIPEAKLLDDGQAVTLAKEDNYWIDLWDDNNNVWELLPGEKMNLFVQIWKNGEENPLDPSEYKLTWTSSDPDVATIKANGDRDDLKPGQQSATVTAAEKGDENKENKTVITVKAVIGSVTKTEKRDLYVHDGIWVITPRDDSNIQLYPGQRWKSGKPEMTCYELGKEPKVKKNIKFKWVYNPDKKGNDTYGKNEPVSLKRGENGGMTVTAKDFNGKYGQRNHIDLIASDPKDPNFNMSNGFEFEVVYYNEQNIRLRREQTHFQRFCQTGIKR